MSKFLHDHVNDVDADDDNARAMTIPRHFFIQKQLS